MKKVFPLVIIFLLLVFALVACNGPSTNGPSDGVIVQPIADLVDFGALNQRHHWENITPTNFANYDVPYQVSRLEARRVESQNDFMVVQGIPATLNFHDFELTNFGEIDAPTFITIFIFSSPAEIINRLSLAGVSGPNMVGLVNYLSRSDVNTPPQMNMRRGFGSAIQDYRDLSDLEQIDDNTPNNFRTWFYRDAAGNPRVRIVNHAGGTNDTVSVYEATQLKRRKMFGELYYIFDQGRTGLGDSPQLARAIVHLLTYSQYVLERVILPRVISANILSTTHPILNDGEQRDINTFDMLLTDFFFDHDTLVYFMAFNESINFQRSGNLANFVPTFSEAVGANGRFMLTLYGFYYQAERNEFRAFTCAEHQEFLALGQLPYFATDAQALRYRDLNATRYREAIRYSHTFLERFYDVQLTFQARQEAHDKTVFQEFRFNAWGNMQPAVREHNVDLTYAGEMRNAYMQGRLHANLLISDVNYQFMQTNANVIATARYERNWLRDVQAGQGTTYTFNQSVRDAIGRRAFAGNRAAAYHNIREVERSVQQLRGVHNTLTHSTISNLNLRRALEFQIFNYRADHVRNVQNTKKTIWVLHLEQVRAQARGLDPSFAVTTVQADVLTEINLDEIGRNRTLISNMEENWRDARTYEQIRDADYNWNEIAREIDETIRVPYRVEHNAILPGQTVPRWQAPVDQVVTLFENTLIRRVWRRAGNTYTDAQALAAGAQDGRDGWSHGFSTAHNLSRLLFNHETVIRHANGQTVVFYRSLPVTGNGFNLYNIAPEFTVANYVATNIPQNSDFRITLDENGLNPQFAFLQNNPGAVISSNAQAVTVSPNAGQHSEYFDRETLDRGQSPANMGWGAQGFGFGGGVFVDFPPMAGSSARQMTAYARVTTPSGVTPYYIVFIFAAWYLDAGFNHIVRPTDTFSVDVRLFPAFYMFRLASAPSGIRRVGP